MLLRAYLITFGIAIIFAICSYIYGRIGKNFVVDTIIQMAVVIAILAILVVNVVTLVYGISKNDGHFIAIAGLFLFAVIIDIWAFLKDGTSVDRYGLVLSSTCFVVWVISILIAIGNRYLMM